MNPLVLFIFLVGCVVGYLVARVQLRGRFLLTLEGLEEEPLPGPWCPPEAAPLQPHRRTLMRTPRCPDGYSAKQVLGYSNFGTPHRSQYPGGFDQWRMDHDDYYGDA